MSSRAPVVVSGAVANKHLHGGEAWVRMSWAVGLERLGFDVYFVEQIAAGACVGDDRTRTEFETSANRRYFEEVMAAFGFAGRAGLILEGTERTWGLPLDEVVDIAAEACLLVNVSGHLSLPEVKERFRRTAYIDVDPGFTQCWPASGSNGARLEGHDCYFTVGENIGTPECRIPAAGIRWRALPQPVVLDQWPVSDGPGETFTTVASWRGPYGRVAFQGRTFGLKVHEFRKFIGLPQLCRQPFEIALDIHPADHADRDALERHGWKIADPLRVAGTPFSFRDYVTSSLGEFSVAQGIYVETGSGWFSDRTVRYLAAGRPVVVQDTGFSRNYPVGDGLIAFRTMDEAREGIESVARDYARHRRAARALAEEFFDSDMVVRRLLDQSEVP